MVHLHLLHETNYHLFYKETIGFSWVKPLHHGDYDKDDIRTDPPRHKNPIVEVFKNISSL